MCACVCAHLSFFPSLSSAVFYWRFQFQIRLNNRCVMANSQLVEMSLCREFPWVPWVPWEFHGNGKYYSTSVGMGKSTGMAWWELAGMAMLHFPISHSEQANKSTNLLDRKTRIGEKWPNLDILFSFEFLLFLTPKDFHSSWVYWLFVWWCPRITATGAMRY